MLEIPIYPYYHQYIMLGRMTHSINAKAIFSVFAVAAALLLIISVLFFLRMVPAINNKVEFVLDASFNYRMTESVLTTGDVPTIDHLSTYPIGKDIKRFLPTGMYHICAAFNRILNKFAPVSLDRSILYFCAFFGSLIALPLFGISHLLYNNRITALATALLGGIIPAYLNRSMSYWYRYETAAIWVIFTSLFFFLLAIRSGRSKKAIIYSALSYLLLVGALYIWRLASIILLIYTLILAYLALREDNFFKKRISIILATLAMYVVMFVAIPGFGLRNPGSSYTDFSRAVFEILMKKMGFNIPISDFTRLIYYNQELGGVSIPSMFGWLFLSMSGIFAVVYIASYFSAGKRNSLKDSVFVFLVFMFTMTFMLSRNKTFLGPITAVTLGESVCLIASLKNISWKRILYALLVLILFVTAFDAWRLVKTRYVNTRLSPNEKHALMAINRLVPSGSPILCFWADGYQIQTYCDRPTVTDGLFESAVIVSRIIEESKAYLSSNDAKFVGLCKDYGVKYILVSKRSKMSCAGYAGVPLSLLKGRHGLTRRGMETLLFRLIYKPNDQGVFKLLYTNAYFSLFLLND